MFTEILHPVTEGNNIPLEVNVIAGNDRDSKQTKNVKNHQEIDHISHSSMNSQTTQSTDLSQPTKIEKPQQPTAERRHHRPSRSNSRASDVTSGYVTAMNVHNAPRVYRKLNGDIQALDKRPRRQRSLPPKWNQNGYIIPTTRIDNISMNRSLDSFQGHGNSRTAYEFMDASRRQQRNDRRVVIEDIEIKESDNHNSDDDAMDDAPWAPTGIFAVFIITLWTAVLKLVDSIDDNGPVVCSEGEEVRLWICSGCLSLVFFLAEIVWKEKNFSKALFGAVLVFSYMMLGHAEPLTCRLGEGKLNEINKWQAAMNFFFAAVLGAQVYLEIAQAIRQKRKFKEKKQKRKRKEEGDSSDEDESVMRVYRV